MRKRKLMLDREVLSSNGHEEIKGASDRGCPPPTATTHCYFCPPSPLPCPDDTE